MFLFWYIDVPKQKSILTSGFIYSCVISYYMDKKEVQDKSLRKLMAMIPPKWGNSHTEEDNLVKGLPKHLRGTKIVQNAIEELYKLGFLTKLKKTG